MGWEDNLVVLGMGGRGEGDAEREDCLAVLLELLLERLRFRSSEKRDDCRTVALLGETRNGLTSAEFKFKLPLVLRSRSSSSELEALPLTPLNGPSRCFGLVGEKGLDVAAFTGDSTGRDLVMADRVE